MQRIDWRWAVMVNLLALLLAACTDVRPIAKIGLIAPFEGLNRRTGYEALAAMRLAIADAPANGIAFIPLALDDSADPGRTRRTAQKLLTDPQVKAVVGPLSPSLAAASGEILEESGVAWFTPFAVAPAGGFTDPRDAEEWAAGLVAAVGAAAQKQGATALVLAGDAHGWPAWDEAAWSLAAGLPTRFLRDGPAGIASLSGDDAIFWLGAADEAAAFLNMLPPALAGLP
ncbi:MAG: ABC transporter substrate-binding protein, partial [Caldilinea sp.]